MHCVCSCQYLIFTDVASTVAVVIICCRFFFSLIIIIIYLFFLMVWHDIFFDLGKGLSVTHAVACCGI